MLNYSEHQVVYALLCVLMRAHQVTQRQLATSMNYTMYSFNQEFTATKSFSFKFRMAIVKAIGLTHSDFNRTLQYCLQNLSKKAVEIVADEETVSRDIRSLKNLIIVLLKTNEGR